MTHRALLLGAAYGTLFHVPQSLSRLEGALERYGFQNIERHCDLEPGALVAVLEQFIATVERGDAVAIVYVGHGGRREGFGYLRPFPGPEAVVGLELGVHLAGLVRKTGNVTLVLDCCHAAGVLEDGSHLDAAAQRHVIAVQRARAREPEVVRGGGPLETVVQLFAAAASQTAIEDLDRQVGLFSSALADVLERCVGLEVGWHEVFDEVCLRMRPVDREQAPALGGRHRRRVPFTERDSSVQHVDFACKRSGPGLHLAAGEISGVVVGERFAVRAVGQPLDGRMPMARVLEVGPEYASLALEQGPPLPDAGVPLRAVKLASAGVRRLRWQQQLEAIGHAPQLPAHTHDVRWGRVDSRNHALTHLPEQGARIGQSDGLWIAFGTRRSEYAYQLYFAVFHVDPDDRLTYMSAAYPQGVSLASDAHFLLATPHAGMGQADTLEWPGLPIPGQHSLILLVSTKQIAAASIADAARKPTRSSLVPPSARYAVKRLLFEVL